MPQLHSSEKSALRRAIEERILLLDGAMGTEIQRRGLGETDFRRGLEGLPPDRQMAGNNDLLVLTRPDVIADIHRSYLQAGADVIETCTFNAQAISQHAYGTEHLVSEINYQGARLARTEADRMSTPDRPRFVVGSVGPTDKILTMDSGLDYLTLRQAYIEQMSALIRGGVDGLLIETIVDTLNAKAAIEAAEMAMEAEGRRVEILLSITVADAAGRTLSGQTVEAFVASVKHACPLTIGMNCSFGADAMLPYLRRLAAAAPTAVSAHPNAGLPDQMGRYTTGPEEMARYIGAFLDEGLVNMVGGCCGTTPEHIAALRILLDNRHPEPRVPAEPRRQLQLAGLEVLDAAGEFVNVGERCNVAGSRKFLRLIKEKNHAEALDIARKQVDDGAMVLDINMDDGMLDTATEMEQFLRLVAAEPDICRVPLMIDSSRFDVIERALRCVQGKAVVNSLSLKEGEEKFLEHARICRRMGAAVVVMAFDEEGQATDYQRRIDICSRAYRLLTQEIGYDPNDIIFDPNILTVATGMAEHRDYALDFIRAAEWIRQNLPGAHVSGGVSNLSFAFRGNNVVREAMHAVFLYHASRAGMDMAIMNSASAVSYDDVDPELRLAIEDVLIGSRSAEATEHLTALASKIAEQGKPQEVPQAAAPVETLPIGERLVAALLKSNASITQEDIDEALAEFGSALAIISGPLMQGMDLVGRHFAEGRMFLPQVVKSARVMKQIVGLLEPYMEAGDEEATAARRAGTVLIATVKGDVHDIGKNIVKVILTCNNYHVVDLGVMVPDEQIVETARKLRPDIVCLSGLITPSLEAMCRVASLMQRAGLEIPLMVGGATTSPTHTAVKIAPLYAGPVLHMRDASQNPLAAARLLGDESARETYIEEIRAQQQQLIDAHLSASAAPAGNPDDKRPQLAPSGAKRPFDGVKDLPAIPIEELRELIDWRYFLHAWKVRPDTDAARNLLADAQALLDELIEHEDYRPLARIGFMPAGSTGHSIVVAADTGVVEIDTPRQPDNGERTECLALCDFIDSQAGSVGMFAVAVSPAFVAKLNELRRAGDDYKSMLMLTVGHRLAEAAAQWVQHYVGREYGWKGIRPAVGYPSLPDQKMIFRLNQLLNLGAVGITLTETGAMLPEASIAGLLIDHPQARYFDALPVHGRW